MHEQPLDLATVEDGGKAFGALGPSDVLKGQFLATKDLFVEEYERIEGLVLGRGGNLALYGEVTEESDNLRLAHLVGVSLAVKEDVAFGPLEVGPLEVGLLGADAVVLAAYEVAHLSKQFGAANDFVRIHEDICIVAGAPVCICGALSLEFLYDTRMLEAV